MGDIFSLFGAEEDKTYAGSFWLYGSTQGVISLPDHSTIQSAQQDLRDRMGSEISFVEERITDGISVLAGKMCRQKSSVAVVIETDTGDVVSHSVIPSAWHPSSF